MKESVNVKALRRLFREIEEDELRQIVEIAKATAALKGGGSGLAWRIARYAVLSAERERRELRRIFTSYDRAEEEGFRFCAEDEIFRRWLDRDDWREFLSRLPYPARRLAEMAESAGGRFVPDGAGPWGARDLSRLRGEVKREFIAWERSHSRTAYERWRRVLVEALRRHRGA